VFQRSLQRLRNIDIDVEAVGYAADRLDTREHRKIIRLDGFRREEAESVGEQRRLSHGTTQGHSSDFGESLQASLTPARGLEVDECEIAVEIGVNEEWFRCGKIGIGRAEPET